MRLGARCAKAMNALAHMVQQALGDQRLCMCTVFRGEANDVEDFFVGLLDLLSDERRCYLLICRLNQS